MDEPLPVDEDSELAEIARPNWAPRDDAGVERALRVLERLAARFTAVRAQAAAWRSEIDAWEESEIRKLRGPATRGSVGLEAFAMAERARTGAKTFTYPSGRIETRAGRDKVTVVDEAALLAWARRECPAAVKVVESVLTSRLPEHKVFGDQMVLEGGEVVPGVSVQSGKNYVSATVVLASQRELPRGPS